MKKNFSYTSKMEHTEEQKKIIGLFDEVRVEFKDEVERVKKMWENDDIMSVLLQKEVDLINNPFYPALRKLFKEADDIIVEVIYYVFDYFDLLDHLRGSNNPFVFNLGKEYWKVRARIREHKSVEVDATQVDATQVKSKKKRKKRRKGRKEAQVMSNYKEWLPSNQDLV